MQTITLKPGRDRSVRRHHPWLFDGAIKSTSGDPTGGLCVVRSETGEWLASGIVSPAASLRARLMRFDGQPVDETWVRARVDDALALRDRLVPEETDAYRVVNSEGDLLPGIVIDRYAGVLTVQVTTSGAEAISPWALAAVDEKLRPRSVVHRRDTPQRDQEKLSTRSEATGEPLPPEGILIRERGLKFFVDPLGGQKTGFFLDQRENRHRIRELAARRSVLNVFSYSGGFGVAAVAGGASRTVNVDSSLPALELAKRNYDINGFLPSAGEAAFVGADAFEWLRAERAAGTLFDLVVLDPPAFVKTKGALDRGLRGYKDVNLQAMRLVAPGGILLTCSCSGLVDVDLFQKVIFGASTDAGVTFRILERRGAGPDHPVLLDCPETEYLKGLLLQRVG